MRMKTLLLVVSLLLVGIYHGGCIQTKNYKLSEKDKEDIAEMIVEKQADNK